MPTLIDEIRSELAKRRDPARADQQRAYMKSGMPFWGVPKGEVARIAKGIASEREIGTLRSFMSEISGAWDRATHREERYALIDITGDKRARDLHTVAILPLYEHMIRTGRWWDIVDAIAPKRFPLIYDRDAGMPPAMREWARDEDIWIRRAAILSQLKRRRQTDIELLTDCIAPSLRSDEFFLRKAIGWALRELSKTDPAIVSNFISVHEEALSPLSLREARKCL